MYEYQDLKVDVNERDENGSTLLHRAAKAGNITLVDFLIHSGADVMSKDEEGRTPLHWAAHGGDLPAVAQLVHHGADIQARDKKDRKPLHYAAMGGDVGTCNYLAEKGGGMQWKDSEGKTPYELAAGEGAKKYLGDFLVKLQYNEMFRERKRRSLPSVTATLTTERPEEPRLTFCTWIRNMIHQTTDLTTDSSPSAGPVLFVDKLGSLCSNRINNFLMLAIIGAGSRNHRRRLTTQQNIRSPPEILMSRIDQFALDAIYNFPS